MFDLLFHQYFPWFVLAFALIVLELLLGSNFILLWSGFSAAVVGLVSMFFPIGWVSQMALFALTNAACLAFWFGGLIEYVKSPTDTPLLNQRARQYIGKKYTLEKPIVNGFGQIKVDDSFWRIEGPDLDAGSQVQIIDVNGVTLIVKSLTD